MKRILLIIALSIPLFVIAQPGGGDPGGDPDVPISGIEWLLIGGGILGAGRIFSRLKKRQH